MSAPGAFRLCEPGLFAIESLREKTMTASRVAQVAIAVGMMCGTGFQPVKARAGSPYLDECFDLREFAFQQSPWAGPTR